MKGKKKNETGTASSSFLHGEEVLQYTGLLRIPQHSTMVKIISKIWEDEHRDKCWFDMETPTAAPNK